MFPDITLPNFRQYTNAYIYDVVEWIYKTDLRTPKGRERSVRLLSIGLGLYSIMDKHFQRARAQGVKAAPENLDFTDREREVRELMQKASEKLSPKIK